jgi:tryptophan halogenase
VQFFPFKGVSPAVANHFNRLADEEFESIRDFIILHYHLTQRTDTQFWKDRQRVDIPDTLKQRIALYKENAIVYQGEADLFRVDSWMQVMRGQGLMSEGYHHVGQLMDSAKLKSNLNGFAETVRRTVAQLPKHEDFVASYCAAPEY